MSDAASTRPPLESIYQFHRLNDDRLEDVLYLFQSVFEKKISLDYLRIKYDTSWCGVKHLCYLAYKDGQPVAFYGALPQQFIHRGKTFLAAQTNDSITLPAHQRKGLHRALALKTYDLMKEHDVQFVYAFHSENTYYSCKKLNWKEGVRTRGHWFSTGMLPWGKAARRLPVLRDWHARRSERLVKALYNQEAAETWMSATDPDQMRTDYNPDFFAYKRFTNNGVLQVGTARIWFKSEAVISVGDVQYESEADLELAVEELRKLGRRLGLSQILFLTDPNDKVNPWLDARAEDFDTYRIGYLDLHSEPVLEDWKVRYGDFDTF